MNCSTAPPELSETVAAVVAQREVSWNEYAIRIHASLMILAFMFFIPLANFLARHYRGVFTANRMCQTKTWSLMHIGLEIVATILAILGFIVLTFTPSGYTGPKFTTHSILGFVLLSLCVASFIQGLFGPRSGRPYVTETGVAVWSWLHFCTGNAVIILAVPSMLSGLAVAKAFPLKIFFPICVPIIQLLLNEIIAKHAVVKQKMERITQSRKVSAASMQPQSQSRSRRSSEMRRSSVADLKLAEEQQKLNEFNIGTNCKSVSSLHHPGTNTADKKFRKILLVIHVALLSVLSVSFITCFCLVWP